MEKGAPVTIQCACCGEPAALVCKGCKTEDPISGSLVGTTRYCGVPCQKKDWIHHKALCKATKAIREFGSLRFETREIPTKEIKSREVKTSELQTPELQTHASRPPASHPHECQPNEPQAHGLHAHDSPPYQVHQDQASTSEGKGTHQSRKTLAQSQNSHTCAFCHNPAVAVCKKCQGAPNSTGGLVQTTSYCSPICEIAYWSSHKEACLASQARRKLYEAGEALQQDYHGYCQGLVIAMLATRTLNANHMILHQEGSTQHSTNAIALLHSMRMSGNVEDERACLACLVGSDHSGKMGIAIKQQLKDLCTEIRENTLTLEPLHRRRFIRQDWQTTNDKHKVLHVFLKNGETYAMDLSGVQFGLTKPVVPWPQYLDEHVRQVEKVEVWDLEH